MKRERRYIIVLGSVLVMFVLLQLFAPKPLNWTPTYLPGDKDPFGAYITRQVLGPFFRGNPIHTNNLTFYELQDSIHQGENIVSLSDRFTADGEAVKVLLNKVDSGSTAFLSAFSFSGKLADTLKLSTADVFFSELVKQSGPSDSTDLKFVLPGTEKKSYYYHKNNVSFYFSTLDSLTRDALVVSTNAWGKPVTLRIPWGKGQLILNCTPLAFTNNYLLYRNNQSYASETLSFLALRPTWWTSYYQVGRLEAQTPLRFILSNEALKWAYYIVLTGVLLFLLFESKRKQRPIQVILPLSNTTLEFVKTIGNMYLHARDHKAIAEKKIAFFMEQIRSTYYLSQESGDAFVELVARKSGNPLEETVQLFSIIKIIQGTSAISEKLLLDMNQKIEKFTRVKYVDRRVGIEK